MNIIKSNFPDLTDYQIKQFKDLTILYENWNNKINVISRKDISELNIRHVLHSLSIAKVINFLPKTKILDVGTGGGFPGIPLAIMFPEVLFHLTDSIGKKIKVVQAIANDLGLKNVVAEKIRSENVNQQYDFIVSRAVTNMSNFVKIVNGKISSKNKNQLKNGILYLKGGDLSEELKDFKHVKSFKINSYFNDTFFDTKKIVYLPMPCTDKDIR
ncbi:16S rRNA (guanine(527)-N(7))-methyltransferase RsmG [Flavobacteriaceae bacterium]|nr:16S rRNA (guanine(527)-N(7))-methyltransferase RsmG [Flavobacteriaceae bacterium]MDA7717413.1 16S rRNA (guanine(527)-N(7))-methyltransferase RsmG [Flavobacteriaceae bacterium]MDB4014193.1 16S rRNA (guanine(527)-N(7))-methyltransferase RsmG [Flavobacteriaceae bacterium]MDB4023687.1 16S rRNA (guanine(527)-N(7))-methyltransferase RsmG [Flavobacteriaceae bacterium]MDB4131361.1 16S rRNA (guanine(527)-N(7))-methyltransferase RsmG [Flavobacteriaceae bacterium]